MLVTWEPEDIKVGIRYQKPGTQEIWLIGYRPDLQGNGGGAFYTGISLADGMVTCPYTKAQLARVLTEGGYHPWPNPNLEGR